MNDLKPQSGKKRKIALAQQSPSHYYVLSLLYYAGIEPNEVEFKFTESAFQAAAAERAGFPCLRKPFRMAELVALVSILLAGKYKAGTTFLATGDVACLQSIEPVMEPPVIT